MNLTELTALTSEDNFNDALAIFFKKHGMAAFYGGQATVVTQPNKPYVWRAWFYDLGYERFIEYVRENPSKFMPKLLSRIREQKISVKGPLNGSTIKYIKLEKLTEANPSPEIDIAEALQGPGINASKIPSTIPELAKFCLNLKMQVNSDLKGEEISQVIQNNPEFFKIVIDLIKNHRANDLSSENIMMRGSDLVINDPFND